MNLSYRILIAGERPQTEQPLSDVLAAAGCDAHDATAAADLAHVAAGLGPDVILLYAGTHEQDRFAAMKRLKMDIGVETVPIILLTPEGDAECAAAGLDAGADDCLAAPPDPRELLARIKAVMRKTEAVRTIRSRADALFLQAVTDPLTGLYNRRYLRSVVERDLACLKRYGRKYSLLLLDADAFKDIPKTDGRLSGDAALKGLGAVIKYCQRAGDVAVRYGDKEFVVVLSDTEITGAAAAAERFRDHIEKHPIPGGDNGKLTVSIGTAEFRREDRGMEDVIKRADDALYAAKREGKNRVR